MHPARTMRKRAGINRTATYEIFLTCLNYRITPLDDIVRIPR